MRSRWRVLGMEMGEGGGEERAEVRDRGKRAIYTPCFGRQAVVSHHRGRRLAFKRQSVGTDCMGISRTPRFNNEERGCNVLDAGAKQWSKTTRVRELKLTASV